MQTTPIAGARLTSHLRALLLMFATYLPPPTSLSAAISVPSANRSTRVPQEILTDAVVEEIKTRCCFVGNYLGFAQEATRKTPAVEEEEDIDLPPSDISLTGSDLSHPSLSEQDSEYSVISDQRPHQGPQGENHLQALSTMYKRHSTATDIQMRVQPPSAQQSGTGRGTLLIPGWIRERAAEILFEGGDVDESSLAETILDGLLKVKSHLLHSSPIIERFDRFHATFVKQWRLLS
jgi:actin-related protein 10